MLPFPSDFFRKPGGPFGQTASLDFGKNLPINEQSGLMIDGLAFADHDGFPVYPQINFALPGATLNGAPAHADIEQSLEANAKIVVIDAETGERAPHWAEFDYLAEEQGTGVIEIRLAKILQHSRRYIVAVRNLTTAAGAMAAPTPGFRALRDGTSTALAGIETRRARFEKEIFPLLEKAGIARKELQIAWDFTTTSDNNATARIRGMRDELYRQIGNDGPEYVITGTLPNPDGENGFIESVISGVARVPNFMQASVASKPNSLRLDDKGLAVAQGFVDVPFRVQIPKSARTATTRAAVMQYGHGFLGTDGEADNEWIRKFANERNFLILSSNMQGMDSAAGLYWFLKLPQDIGIVARIGDEPLQGAINHLALQRLMKGRFAREPLLQRESAPIYDPAQIFYHGNSQGGTQGFVVSSMSRDLTRVALGEPGISIAYVLARAANWREIVVQVQPKYPNPYDFASIECLVAVGWDKGDGTNLAPYNSPTPPADGTPKTLLIHAAIEDAQVNNDVTQLLARSVNAVLRTPETRPVWGLKTTSGAITNANVLVEFEYGVPVHPKSNQPAELATDTHDLPKKSRIAQEQMWQFFQTGEIRHTCDGTCNPD
jgi:hypothetical protein